MESNFDRQHSGFSLVEVLIVVGIMGIIAAGMAVMTSNSQRDVMAVSATNDFNSLVTNISGLINTSGTSCASLFAGDLFPHPAAALPANVNLTVGGLVIKGGANTAITPNLTTTQVQFINTVAEPMTASLPYPAAGISTINVHMILTANRVVGGGAVAGGSLITHDFGLNLVLNPAWGITSCTGTTNTTYWSTNNAVDIFNTNTGMVGVGTNTPAAKLDVNGTLRAGSAALGGACVPNGSLGYEAANSAPLYCKAGIWTIVGTGSPSIKVYKCPMGGCSPGGGAWYTQGCVGQVSSQTICQNTTFNGGIITCTSPCPYLGTLILGP